MLSLRVIIPLLVFPLAAAPHARAGGNSPGAGSPVFGKAAHTRTERSEIIVRSGLITRVANIYAGRKFFFENGEWKKINLAPQPESLHGFSMAVKAGRYSYRFDPGNPGKGGRFEQGRYHMTHAPSGDWRGCRATVKYLPEGVKETIQLEKGSPRTVSWTMRTNTRANLQEEGLVFTDEKGGEVFRTPHPEAWDSQGNEIPAVLSLEGDLLSCSLKIPEDAAWPVWLDPTVIVGDIDNKTGYMCAVSTVYSGARDSTSATYPDNPDIAAWTGQWHDGNVYRVHRTSLVFDTTVIPEAAIIDSAAVLLVTNYDGTQEEFDMKLVAATFSGSWSKYWYNDFAGWSPGEQYQVIPLSQTLNSGTCHTAGDTCRFTLNAAGLDSIHLHGETKFMLMSADDINNIQQPSGSQKRLGFDEDSPCLMVWHHLPVEAPANFTMTPLDSAAVACSWTDMSDNEQQFRIVNAADSTVIHILPANAASDTIRGLSMNTRYIWAAMADSAGTTSISNPDTVWTLLNPPQYRDIRIRPISSDTLRVTIAPPPNQTAGLTGMEVSAVSGPGATGSGWLAGNYLYCGGGLSADASYVYKVRYRNGGGDVTAWSPEVRLTMRGTHVQTVVLRGDAHDDYSDDFNPGARDSLSVRAGRSDTGRRLDGFVSFRLPWDIRAGGVDSLFLSMTRTAEAGVSEPSLILSAITVPDLAPVETLDLGKQERSGAAIAWTIDSGAGQKRSPNLRNLLRAWQDLDGENGFDYGFGICLAENGQGSGERAVFLDSSNPSWSGDTKLTVYYTPGAPDTLLGAPSGLALEPLGPDVIRASWADGAKGEYGYLLLNMTDLSPVAGADTLAANTMETTVAGLTPNTVYQWVVQAVTPDDKKTSSGVSARTVCRTPGSPLVTPVSAGGLRFVIDPRDNPGHTEFAVQDSVSGWHADPGDAPTTLRPGPLGAWGWRTFAGWGGAMGDSLAGLEPNTMHGLRVKAR